MSITSWNEIGTGNTGTADEQGTTHQRAFRAISNNEDDTSIDVLAYASCPAVEDPYSTTYPNFLCTKVEASRQDGEGARLVWIVKATYEDRLTDFDGTKLDISFGSRKLVRPMSHAYDIPEQSVGHPYYDSSTYPGRRTRTKTIVNSAGVPFDEPYEREFTNTIIRIARNETNINPSILFNYRDTVNLYAITVADVYIPAMYGKMNMIDIDPRIDSEKNIYYRVEYEIEVATEEAWWAYLLNRGHQYLGSDDKLRMVTEEATNRTTTAPQLLTSAGGLLAAGGTPTYSLYYVWYPWSWEPLGLPTTVAGIEE